MLCAEMELTELNSKLRDLEHTAASLNTNIKRYRQEVATNSGICFSNSSVGQQLFLRVRSDTGPQNGDSERLLKVNSEIALIKSKIASITRNDKSKYT